MTITQQQYIDLLKASNKNTESILKFYDKISELQSQVDSLKAENAALRQDHDKCWDAYVSNDKKIVDVCQKSITSVSKNLKYTMGMLEKLCRTVYPENFIKGSIPALVRQLERDRMD